MADSALFLALDDDAGTPVMGECTVKGYEGQIQLTSFKWGGAGEPVRDWGSDKSNAKFAGRHCKFNRISITRDFDLASSRLYGDLNQVDACVYDSALITAVTFETGSDATDLVDLETGSTVVMTVELHKVRVYKVDLKAAQKDKGASLTETVELGYEDVVLSYYPPLSGVAGGGKRASSPKTFQAGVGSAEPEKTGSTAGQSSKTGKT